jgi:drug/metabolite transporter (DMT)-like permease
MNTNRRLDLIAMLFGLGAAITGGVGIVGYALRIPALIQPTAATAPIVLAAALAVLLGGIATMAAAAPTTMTSRRLSAILGVIVALIGAIAVAEQRSGSTS